MEEQINELHELIKKMYPDAVAVRITVDGMGIKVVPEYITNTRNYSVRNISGNWVIRLDE